MRCVHRALAARRHVLVADRRAEWRARPHCTTHRQDRERGGPNSKEAQGCRTSATKCSARSTRLHHSAPSRAYSNARDSRRRSSSSMRTIAAHLRRSANVLNGVAATLNLNTVYSASYRVALTVTLNTPHGSAAGSTISLWSHVCLALHHTSFDAF
jgi:hypothetical protein